MSFRIGQIDPLQLTFNVMNILLQKGVVSSEDAKNIVIGAMDPALPMEEKEKLLQLLTRKN